MTYRPNLPVAAATTTQAGVVKPDGTTISVASDATASVVGTAVTALTDISSGSLGGPAPSDIDTLNRAGVDYKVTLSARSALVRKTPAGSRTITLASGATVGTLTATDNDKQVVVTGVAGSLAADGTITDGFGCFVINKTGSALTLSGINGLLGATGLPAGSSANVYMAASAIEAATIGGSTLPIATTTTVGAVKPDGSSLTSTSDGTLSVVTVTTHALPSGTAPIGADEVATYSSASSSDVKYTMSQIAGFALVNIQSWTTSNRPTLPGSQFALGYNSTLSRFEFWNGSAWNQHVRVSDLAGTTSQLFSGTGTNGVAAAVSLGTGLSLTSNTLNSIATTPVTTVSSSGAAQAFVFPGSGSRAYDVTLTANCSFSLSGGTTGELQAITLVIRGGAGGFTVTWPSAIRWKGGSAPTIDLSAGSLNMIRFQTSDGGSTIAGNV